MVDDSKLHVVIFPWLAFGHLLPALDLSKSLASKGHHVSFISTPKNIKRLPPLHPSLSPLITFINLPFPRTHNLPEDSQASTDIPPRKSQLLVRAFDALQPHFAKFLQTFSSSSRPDWILYDFAHHWLPQIAVKHDIPCVFFGPYCAAMLSFLGPPSILLKEEGGRFSDIQSLITPPKWIPFQSDIAFRMHEVISLSQRASLDISEKLPTDVSEMYRFGVAIRDCEFVALRSCFELESEWLKLLPEVYNKPVVPVGSLHPVTKDYLEIYNPDDDEKWVVINDWLEKQNDGSVIYVAFGTEATLNQNQVTQLAIGLEKSEVPFFWVLRAPPESDIDVLTMLPDGFMDRVKGRGVVWKSWVPQVKILGHKSVGGVLTQCGWNSVNEALGFGRVLLLLPMVFDQGLIARSIVRKKLGYEIPKDERDGSFSSESVADSVRMVMVEKEGEELRSNAVQMKEVLQDKTVMTRYLDDFIGQLKSRKRK